MTTLGEQYRAWQAAKPGNGSSGSAIYSLPLLPEQRAAQRPSIYEDRPYEGLSGYAGKQADKLDQRAGESFEAYERRLKAIARALPAGEVERRLEAARKTTSEQSWSWEAHRAEQDGRVGSAGIFGNATPQERAAALGSRFGGRVIGGQGALQPEPIGAAPASMVQINQIMRQREAQQQSPQRTDLSQLRSSGEGIIAR